MSSADTAPGSKDRIKLPSWLIRPHPVIVGCVGIIGSVALFLSIFKVEKVIVKDRFDIEVKRWGVLFPEEWMLTSRFFGGDWAY